MGENNLCSPRRRLIKLIDKKWEGLGFEIWVMKMYEKNTENYFGCV